MIKKYILSNFASFDPLPSPFPHILNNGENDANERYDSDSDEEDVLDEERNAFDRFHGSNPIKHVNL